MKTLWSISVLAAMILSAGASDPAAARGRQMIDVEEGQGFCQKGWDGDCHEYRFTDLPGLRFIIYGFEDGSNSRFYRRSKAGKYLALLDVFPIARRSSGREIQDYAEYEALLFDQGTDGPVLYATFDHGIIEAGTNCHEAWQKRVPAVLFRGERKEKIPSTIHLRWQRISLNDLAAQARILPRGQKMRLWTCGAEPPSEDGAPPSSPSPYFAPYQKFDIKKSMPLTFSWDPIKFPDELASQPSPAEPAVGK